MTTGVMLMADLVVTEAEVGHVTDACRPTDRAETALHKHLLEQSPRCVDARTRDG